MLSARKRKRLLQARSLRILPPFRLGRFHGKIAAAFREAVLKMVEGMAAKFQQFQR